MTMYSIDEEYDIEAQNNQALFDTHISNTSLYEINDEMIDYYVTISILEKNMNLPYLNDTELQFFKSYPSIRFKKFIKRFNKRILISQKVKKYSTFRHNIPKKTITITSWCNACNCDIDTGNLYNHINSLDSLILHNHNNFIIEYLQDIDELKKYRKDCIKVIKDLINYYNSKLKLEIGCNKLLTFFKKPLTIIGLFVITLITVIIIVCI